MEIGIARAVSCQIRTLFQAGTLGGLTDRQLLERFAMDPQETAEAAFGVLLERHGPMVLCVCRGVLDDPLDAQDAFQATFLVLVRRPAPCGSATLSAPGSIKSLTARLAAPGRTRHDGAGTSDGRRRKRWHAESAN